MDIGASKIHDNRQVVMTLDHDVQVRFPLTLLLLNLVANHVQNKSESNLKKYQQIEEFATKHGVDFYPAG